MGGVIGFENASLYIGTKHAVIGITKTASIHHRGIWPSVEAQHAFAAGTPAGRFGSAEEMATVVAFLASDDSSYVSGHALLADAGYSIA
jgi:enoyl-[acyl-carrier-protein] reductase (NADH)